MCGSKENAQKPLSPPGFWGVRGGPAREGGSRGGSGGVRGGQKGGFSYIILEYPISRAIRGVQRVSSRGSSLQVVLFRRRKGPNASSKRQE